MNREQILKSLPAWETYLDDAKADFIESILSSNGIEILVAIRLDAIINHIYYLISKLYE